jgi:hypothetical protein
MAEILANHRLYALVTLPKGVTKEAYIADFEENSPYQLSVIEPVSERSFRVFITDRPREVKGASVSPSLLDSPQQRTSDLVQAFPEQLIELTKAFSNLTKEAAIASVGLGMGASIYTTLEASRRTRKVLASFAK